MTSTLTTNPSPNVGNIDLDELQKRFAELGYEGFDAENPPTEALQEIVRHVQLDDDQVALLFGEELGLTWAELREMPRRMWRQTATRVRTVLCDGSKPQAWLPAAGGASVASLTGKVLGFLALPATGGIESLVGIVMAGIVAEGVDRYCASKPPAS